MTPLIHKTPGSTVSLCPGPAQRTRVSVLQVSPLAPPLPAGWIQNAKWRAEPENPTRQMAVSSRDTARRPSRLLRLHFGGQTKFCSVLGSQDVSNWFTQSLFVVVIFLLYFCFSKAGSDVTQTDFKLPK